MWGRLPIAGLLLAGCAFEPQGSAPAGEPATDAGSQVADAAGPFEGPEPPDGAALAPVLLETLTVPATGEVVPSTAPLRAGASYQLVASGVVSVRDGYSGDADYYWDDVFGIGGDSAGGVDIGLAIDDPTIDETRSPDWGEYSSGHSYQAEVTGTGAALAAQFHDPNFGNNSGSLTLEIWGPP